MFEAKNTNTKYLGEVIYRRSENSFDFSPLRNADITLMIGYLYLGIDSEIMLARHIWGYSPFAGWLEKKLIVPTYFAGELILSIEMPIGISTKLGDSVCWKTYYDSEQGWVCIGDYNDSVTSIAVEFAENTIAARR